MRVLDCRLFSENKSKQVECIAVTPNGYFCAVSQSGGFLTVFDTVTFHSWLCISSNESYSLRSLFFTRKGRPIFDGEFLYQSSPQGDETTSDADSESSQTTASTSLKKSPSKKIYSPSSTYSDEVFDLRFYRLIGLGLDGRITEWDLSSGHVLDTMPSYGGAIFQGAVSPSGDQLALACTDGSVKIFSLLNDVISFSHSLPNHSEKLLSVSFLNDRTIFSGSSDGVILDFDLNLRMCKNTMSVGTGKKIAKKSEYCNISIWCLLCIESENVLFSGDSSGTVIVWDLITYTAIRTFIHHQGDVLTLSKLGNSNTEEDSTLIISTGMDGSVVSYINTEYLNESEGLSKWVPKSFCYPLNSVVGSVATISTPHSKGPVAISGTWDGKLIMWLSAERRLKIKRRFNTYGLSPNYSYYILPDSVLSGSPNIHIADNERLVLRQNVHSIEMWFISNPETITKTENLSINPFAILCKKLNNMRYSFGETCENQIGNLIPVQPIKLIEFKFSSKTNKIRCSALSKDGNYVVGSFLDGGIKAMYVDLETLNINSVSIESCKNIFATFITFLTNTTLIVGGFYTSNICERHVCKPNIWIVDIERDMVISSLELEVEEDNKIGVVSKIIVSPDNQWLAVITSYGYSFIIDIDSLKVEVDLNKLKHDIFDPFSKNNYSIPITSVCFNRNKSGFILVLLSDGKYFFYSIASKRLLSKENLITNNSFDHFNDSVCPQLVYSIPNKLYSPLLNGPIVNGSWIITSGDAKSHGEEGSYCENNTLVVQTCDCVRYLSLSDNKASSNNAPSKELSCNGNGVQSEIEKEICGPVYKLPRFKKQDTFSDRYLLYPERSLESIVRTTIKSSDNSKGEANNSQSSTKQESPSTPLKADSKSVFGVFWVSSPKWLSLVKVGAQCQDETQTIPEGFLVLLSSKNPNGSESVNGENVEKTPSRKKYGD